VLCASYAWEAAGANISVELFPLMSGFCVSRGQESGFRVGYSAFSYCLLLCLRLALGGSFTSVALVLALKLADNMPVAVV
jgi:hypothetical protein